MKKENLKKMMRRTIQSGKSIVDVDMNDVEEFINHTNVVDGNQLISNSESWIAMMIDEIRRLKSLNQNITFRNTLFILKSKNCSISMADLDQVCKKLTETIPVNKLIWGLMTDESMNEHQVNISLLISE